ncbi:MAG: hypothetical protein K2G04_02100 [Oscillospiraceae bacterium]|nr:hypothetical protein [Oscillospiraceae bacterium]
MFSKKITLTKKADNGKEVFLIFLERLRIATQPFSFCHSSCCQQARSYECEIEKEAEIFSMPSSIKVMLNAVKNEINLFIALPP